MLYFLRSSFEETEALVNAGAKIPHPVARGLAPSQEPHLQGPEKSSQKELEAMALGTASDTIEIVSGVRGVRDHWGGGWGQLGRTTKGPSTHLVTGVGPALPPGPLKPASGTPTITRKGFLFLLSG